MHLQARGDLGGRDVLVTVMVAALEGPARSVLEVDLTPEELLTRDGVLASAVLVVTPRGARVAEVAITDPRLRALPALCFSLRDDSKGVPAMVLSAHDPAVLGVATDAFLTPVDLAELRAQGRDTAPLGELRWLVGSGEIHQVEAHLRRRKVATRLLMAGEVVCAAHGWPLLRGGGERTELGDALVSSASNPAYWSERTKPMTKLAPPITR
jgi:hypothetical protein